MGESKRDKCKYRKLLDEYDYLKDLKEHAKSAGEASAEVEVTTKAVDSYSKCYSIYSKQNGWTVEQYSTSRKQMSTSGAWLSNEEEGTICIVGDILTGKSAFNKAEQSAPDLHELFMCVYYTVGNCMPWPEGGNLGGGLYKVGGPDNFSRKLSLCKEIFDGTQSYETEAVQARIKNGKTLGRGISKKSCIQYWIDTVWKDKCWNDFVEENHLQDMVDEEYNPEPFVVGADKLDLSDRASITKTYIQSIKMIIQRGYRISHDGRIDPGETETIFNKLVNGLGIET